MHYNTNIYNMCRLLAVQLLDLVSKCVENSHSNVRCTGVFSMNQAPLYDASTLVSVLSSRTNRRLSVATSDWCWRACLFVQLVLSREYACCCYWTYSIHCCFRCGTTTTTMTVDHCDWFPTTISQLFSFQMIVHRQTTNLQQQLVCREIL